MKKLLLYELPIILFEKLVTEKVVVEVKKFRFNLTHGGSIPCQYGIFPVTDTNERPTLALLDRRPRLNNVQLLVLDGPPRLNSEKEIDVFNEVVKIIVSETCYSDNMKIKGKTGRWHHLEIFAKSPNSGEINIAQNNYRLLNKFSFYIIEEACKIYNDLEYAWVTEYLKIANDSEIYPLSIRNRLINNTQ